MRAVTGLTLASGQIDPDRMAPNVPSSVTGLLNATLPAIQTEGANEHAANRTVPKKRIVLSSLRRNATPRTHTDALSARRVWLKYWAWARNNWKIYLWEYCRWREQYGGMKAMSCAVVQSSARSYHLPGFRRGNPHRGLLALEATLAKFKLVLCVLALVFTFTSTTFAAAGP